MSQQEVLKIINENPGLTGKEIADKLESKYECVSQYLCRLSKNRMIEKEIEKKGRLRYKYYIRKY